MLRLVGAMLALLAATGAAEAQSAFPTSMMGGNFYIGGGIGYGGASSRMISITDGFACPNQSQFGALPVLTGGVNGCSTAASGFGFSAHALVGYTVPGWVGVSGVELRARLGNEALSGGLGGAVPLSNTVINSASGYYRTTINGGLAVSGRLGANLMGFVPFLRAGVGVAQLNEELVFDSSQSRACLTCTLFGGKINLSRAGWAPTGVIGAGLEIPIGTSFFVRAEGEMEAIFHPGADFATMMAKQQLSGGGTANTVAQAALKSDNWLIARRIILSGGMKF